MKISKLYLLSALLLNSYAASAFEVNAFLDWFEPDIKSISVTGVIDKVAVHSGQKVNKNQLLAQLDLRPYKIFIEKHKAEVKQLEPLIVDARVEFNHAEQLFERTVLSEVDLQKKQGVLNQLEAQQAVAYADLKLAQLKYKEAQLYAPYDARLVFVNIMSGMVITDDNMSEKKIILTRLGKMSAKAILNLEQAAKIQLGHKVKLVINGDQYKGKVISFTQQAEKSQQYIYSIEFEHGIQKNFLAGQQVTAVF